MLNIAGIIFSGTLFVGVGNCMTVQPMIFMQREAYYRERAAGMISVLPYALAQQLVEVMGEWAEAGAGRMPRRPAVSPTCVWSTFVPVACCTRRMLASRRGVRPCV